MTRKDQIDALIGEAEEVTDDISDVSWMDIPVLLVFAILFVIVALQFFTRYVLNDSLGWTEEIARYFLILLGFLGGVTCVRLGKHIFLEFAYHYMAPRVIKPVVLGVEALVTVFWGYAGWLGVELAQRTNSSMVSVQMPKAYLYYAVALGCAGMAGLSAVILVRQARRPAQDIAAAKLPFISEDT
ncbi:MULTISPECIES: TRAP transporter small permease [Marinovum]|jgi:TRAP-type C4-dicarboxylate transport system permease small subunit|uniref:TRAP transporter small permease protein n=1 Tax=Marinovum algicola TaxID=42444 RepID=A0A975WDC7_9RHOB|nr:MULTISPECIES: TRAP transporter small permease [Marinovum]MDD9740916.1 TRAP transporter small permease [Marinovum sp. SP66]MDD9745965.1 TRAP transporter small permease [Marinovum sp. PR37]SEK00067.1 TRAP-type C4-dicarboxylate transport system, small permease component [Marinovum algicola]SLN73228.1 Tripartite ATP-independent periplasmic transporters, DctQ component [Marinovum algicola]